MIRIQSEPYDLSWEVELIRMKFPRTGAIVVFEGIAREFTEKSGESWLEFDCYLEMAEKKLREIENEAREKFPILDIVVIHRIGRIEINEGIVLVVTSASHRQAAYEANEWFINELKRTVPIWKKEVCAKEPANYSFGK